MSAEKMPGIKHIVAIASGKGGVGKSTLSVHLAIALAHKGLRVGLVDLDILGPSVPIMLGIHYGEPPDNIGGKFVPIQAHGIKTISMGMLTDHDSPAILRGPMVTKYMRLFIEQVDWGELDVLLLDLPPGTGDTQLSLAQAIPLSGAVIITTPQEVSLNIARRGLRMFEKVQVPILGMVENMAGFGCPSCGVVTHVFKEHGATKLADQTHTRLLGSVPLDPRIVEAGDAGIPVSVQHPSAASTHAFASVADALCDALEQATGPVLAGFTWQWQSGEGAPDWDHTSPTSDAGNARIPVSMRKKDPRTLQIRWQDGVVLDYDVRDLRLACPCAHCVDEVSRVRTLDPNSIPSDIEPRRLSGVGRYAVTVSWTDGHSTGIYSYDRLRESGEHAAHNRFEV